MGQMILDSDGVVARRIGAGAAHGFEVLTSAIVIATPARARNEDYIVLTLAEARKMSEAILAHLAEE